MIKIYAVIIFLCLIVLSISCEQNYLTVVDTKTNVYKELSQKSNNEIDSIVKSVDTIEVIKNLKKAPKVFKATNELAILSEIFTASIEGEINMDSIGMTIKNTLLLKNKNNVSSVGVFNGLDSTKTKKGYTVHFLYRAYTSRFQDAINIWQSAHENYNWKHNDSISKDKKRGIEVRYNENLELLKSFKYVVVEEDVLLIPPKLEFDKKRFISGYIVTHLYVFEIKTQKKVAQTMVLSSNSNKVEYTTFKEASFSLTQQSKATVALELRENLINRKSKTIDSIFHNNTSFLE